MAPAARPWPPPTADTPLAVLAGGGLDSGVLLAEAVRAYPAVHPICVRTGAAWEAAEREHLLRFLDAIRTPVLMPLVVLDQPTTDLYGLHWSVTGEGVPDDGSPDAAVYLPGRNVLLLSKPLLWCHLNGVPELATAPLAGNPFADATADFYDRFAEVVGRAVGGSVRVLRPYAALSKAGVLARGRGLPLELTFSCLRPADGRHCGRCNKCAERQAGFASAGVPDPTAYADRASPPRRETPCSA